MEVAALGIELKGEPNLLLSAFTVPLICQPLQGQPVNQVVNDNACFSGLRLTDYCAEGETLNVDIPVGLDNYWTLVTGHTIRGTQGPTALHTKLGWVLSGPVSCGNPGGQQRSNLVTTHVLTCATEQVPYEALEGEVKKIWDLESLGIKTPSIHEEFLEKLTHSGDHYQVNLPWKATHPPLPDNYELSQRRLSSLLSRLRKEPDVLKEHDNVIKDQIDPRPTGRFLKVKATWQRLVAQLQASKPIILPRCYYTGIEGEVIANELHGFCDASARAYGTVVYLRIVTTHGNYIRFVASKTRVAPLSNQTIPRLELLSAVVLARLMHSVKEALTSEIKISRLVCWTDSKVAWYWIVQSTKEWKQFLQHRVDEIRKLVPTDCWNHCPGPDNPADILSRGMACCDLTACTLWWNGPK